MTTAPTPDLRALAEAAEGNGEHIYTHPIDSNKWRENEAWHRAASPGAVLHLLDRIQELEGKLGRFQGVPLPLIEAINTATGSNDWQGDHSPAELLEPACRAIAELEARKPLPLSYRAGAMTSGVDGGATVSLHFNDMAEAEAWFVAITDQHDAALTSKAAGPLPSITGGSS